VVELTRIEHGGAVGGAVAAQLGSSSFEVLVAAPVDEPVLLLVDNCEHVAEEAAQTIDRLLASDGLVTVLATSRSPLAVTAESIVALAPLPVPPPGALVPREGAVRLFCERARDNGVPLGEADLELVGELCRRLDGMPLAIELAAARLRVLGIGELLDRLERGVDVLRRHRHTGAARHRSVYDTIEWSARLLDEACLAGFARLGVCPGPISLDLATGVLGGPPEESTEIVEQLVDASLLVAERDGATTRFRMLEPIRAVALRELEGRRELTAARERLAEHVFSFVTTVAHEATQVWGPDLLPTLMQTFDHIDVALRHCLEHDAEPARARGLYMVLWGAVHQSRVDDVVALGELVVARWPGPEGTNAADALATLAMAKLLCGQPEEALALAEAALPHTDGSWGAAVGLRRVMALAARYRADHTAAEALLAEASSAAAAIGFVTMDLECRAYRAQDLAALGRREEALGIVREVALAGARQRSILNEIWARTVEASILLDTGGSAGEDSGVERARAVAADALAASEAIAYPFGISCNLQTVALCDLGAGRLADAAASSQRLLDVFARSGPGDLRRALDVAAAVLHAAGHPAAPDLAAVARRLPETNPMVLGIAGPEPTAAGAALDRQAATRLARAALAAVAAATPATPVVDAPAEVAPSTSGTAAPRATFLRAGDVWDVTFEGRTVHIAASKGMSDLATLLRRPGQEFHCVELAGVGVEAPSTGEVIDATARRRYEARVRELQGDIDEAEAHNDRARAERARAELDALVDHLTAALGRGGRVRRAAGTSERARSAVTHRLRGAIRRIADVEPALGRHLEASVSTGTYCRYEPVTPIDWTL
jgi:non-specific serine/threonine protein kinase